jgi:superfamily II DNA or RNA helicase
MRISIEKVNESFLKVYSDDYSLLKSINEYFSFFAENYKFMPNYKNEYWNGKIKLFDLTSCLLPLGLYSNLTKFLNDNGYKFEKNTNYNKIQISNENIIDFIKNQNKKIKPRIYQLKGLLISLKENKCIIQLPTGSGKSYLIFLYIKYLLENYIQDDDKILLIVPQKSIVFQMRDEFINYDNEFKDLIYTIIAGCKKYSPKPIHISTWQSVYKLESEHFENYKVVIVDECHHAKAKSIETILKKCINATFRLGVTATINNNNYKIILRAHFGNIYELEKTKKLIDQKFLSPLSVYNFILKYPLETRLNIAALNHRDFNGELKIALANKKRHETILKIISKIDKNCLVLFKRIAYGKKLYENLKALLPEKTIYYIDGQIDVHIREEIRKNLENENGIILIATNLIFSQSVNIRNLHYIVITMFNKSKIAVMQTIGRGLRPHHDKEKLKVIDFIDDMQVNAKEKKENETPEIPLTTCRNILLQHFYDRIKIYKEEKYDYKIKRINL